MPSKEKDIAKITYYKNENGIIYGRKMWSSTGELVASQMFSTVTSLQRSFYNDIGQLESEVRFRWNRREWYSSYKYDDKHRLIQKCRYDQNDLISRVESWQYINDTDFYYTYAHPQGGWGRRELRKVDKDNRLIYKKDTSCSEETKFQYDDNGLLLSEKSYWGRKRKPYKEHIYTYNKSGKILKHSFFSEDKLVRECHYSYDENNRLLLLVCYDYINFDFTRLRPQDELIDYNPNISYKHIYEYESSQKYIETRIYRFQHYDKGDTVSSGKYIVELNEDNTKKVGYHLNEKNEIDTKTEYEYNQSGQIIRIQNFSLGENLKEYPLCTRWLSNSKLFSDDEIENMLQEDY